VCWYHKQRETCVVIRSRSLQHIDGHIDRVSGTVSQTMNNAMQYQYQWSRRLYACLTRRKMLKFGLGSADFQHSKTGYIEIAVFVPCRFQSEFQSRLQSRFSAQKQDDWDAQFRLKYGETAKCVSAKLLNIQQNLTGLRTSGSTNTCHLWEFISIKNDTEYTELCTLAACPVHCVSKKFPPLNSL